MSEYGVYSQFDIKKHKDTFINYLEVIIMPDGTVRYAVPSHQILLINIACEKEHVTKKQLDDMCPKEYYYDFMTWLVNLTGCVAVWTSSCSAPETPTKRQIAKLKEMKMEGIYKGRIPARKDEP